MDAAVIEKEALRLPEVDRAFLADRLLQSISPIPSELKNAWIKEANERMEAFREGRLTAVAGPQALSSLRAKFSQ
jgi:hypothetical protein